MGENKKAEKEGDEMKENPRLKAAVEEAERLKGEPLTDTDIYRLYLAQFMKDRKAGQLDEYEPEEIEKLSSFIDDVLHRALDEEIEQLKKDQTTDEPGKKYRTRSDARKAGAITKLPTSLAIPTLKGYQNSMSLYKDKESGAYLQLFSSTDKLRFKNGKLYFSNSENAPNMQEISEVELQNLKTKEGIEDIDLSNLRIFYSIILDQFQKTKYTELKDIIRVPIPLLAEYLGWKANYNKQSVNLLLGKVQSFHNVVGVLHGTRNGKPTQSYYQVLNFEYYDEKNNVVAFSSPYMNYLLRTIFNIAVRKDKNGKARLKKSGEPLLLPNHSYLIDGSIAKERNKAAVENVVIIISMIERAGDNIPRIKASTLIEHNPQLQERLENSTNKRQLLKRTFAKTWELLRSKTRLAEVYEGIALPDPKDPAYLPNETELENLVISFPHNGKKKA